ncbi:MAG: 2-oxoacid:ferredoxin oxidoreductase subunit beta [Gammaproteobacteria bacterium]|nr:2-oxoacid:ferredoxin oxidoreductase subunit beta [Gammaproteobacteria bacterium]
MNQPNLTLKDFASDQEVRWCPGCGDYAILKTVQKLLPALGRPRENQVFVSGIGCSSRFPYYMNTYGFHTIHGRAPAVATGVKLANSELDVWVITGDGDGLSIGGNHMIHTLRRNLDLQILLFNNEIYGLTKGQYSPTSRIGTRSPSSPAGSIDPPLSPCAVAFGAGGSFIARSIDTHARHLTEVIGAGHAHKGTAFIEILQNCPIYNDGIFEPVKDRQTAPDFRVEVEHGKPVLFGKNNEKAIRLDRGSLTLEVVPADSKDVLVHDETNPALAQLLAAMHGPDFPIAIGVLYRRQQPSFDEQFSGRKGKSRQGNLGALLLSGNTWAVT